MEESFVLQNNQKGCFYYEKYNRRKTKTELLEIIFNRPIKGEGYIHGSSYKWKQIVFQHYNKIKRKEITIEELIKILQKKVCNLHNLLLWLHIQ